MKQVRGARFIPLLTGSGFPGGFLSFSGFLCRLMVILDVKPKNFILVFIKNLLFDLRRVFKFSF